MSVLKFPPYIVRQIDDSARTHFQRQTRTFNDNDKLKLKSTIAPKVEAFKNSFFYKSLNFWNSLPRGSVLLKVRVFLKLKSKTICGA